MIVTDILFSQFHPLKLTIFTELMELVKLMMIPLFSEIQPPQKKNNSDSKIEKMLQKHSMELIRNSAVLILVTQFQATVATIKESRLTMFSE